MVEAPGFAAVASCGTPPVVPAPWRVATLADYTAGAAEIAENASWQCPFVTADLDADGRPDSVFVAVNDAARESAIIAILAAGGERILRADTKPTSDTTTLITGPMALKPPGSTFGGEYGARDRDGLPVPIEAVRAVNGVQACSPLHPEQRFKYADDASSLCYCAELFWIEAGVTRSARSCD